MIIDAVVTLQTGEGRIIPVLFVEIDQNQLDSRFDHKDIVKSAISMGAALKSILGECRHESLQFLQNVCVYGILAGGTKFDICAIYPDFGNARQSDFGALVWR